MMIKI